MMLNVSPHIFLGCQCEFNGYGEEQSFCFTTCFQCGLFKDWLIIKSNLDCEK
jgi:hypothetical protein